MGRLASIKTGFSTFNFGGCVILTGLALYECCGSRRRARLRVYSINVMRALHRAWFREDLADRFRSDEGWANPKKRGPDQCAPVIHPLVGRELLGATR